MSVVAMLQGTVETDLSTMRTALSLARRMNVPLRGLCALPDPNSALMVIATPEAAGLTSATTQSVFDMQEEVLSNAREAFRTATEGAESVTCEFKHEVNTVERAAANAAALSEAVVFPRIAADGSQPLNPAFEHILMDAHLPLVLAGTAADVAGPAIIAWDGSNGAARAVRFHLPILKALGDVIIAQNTDDLEKDPQREISAPEALSDWLVLQGISSRVMEIEGEVAAGLLAMAKGSGAGLIIAGAYGHSRLTERLFGGTTRRLLKADSAPALALAH